MVLEDLVVVIEPLNMDNIVDPKMSDKDKNVGDKDLKISKVGSEVQVNPKIFVKDKDIVEEVLEVQSCFEMRPQFSREEIAALKEEEKRIYEEERRIRKEQIKLKKEDKEKEKQDIKEQRKKEQEERELERQQLQEKKKRDKEEREKEMKILREEKRILKLEKEKEEAAQKKSAALTQMRYLLSQCEKYSNIYKKTVAEKAGNELKDKNIFLPTMDDVENAKGEALQVNEKDITDCLQYFEGGTLHPYQIEGVRWFYMLYMNASNGILADEMGLGKTIQVIALICVLLAKKIAGPFLIVAPLSTVPNWENEFKRFAPKVPLISITGSAESRRTNLAKMRQKFTIDGFTTSPVVLVTYQTPLLEFNAMSLINWKYIIVDEAQRIKNFSCRLSRNLRKFKSENRLVLTGTPLQNNLQELWALLNFILPNFFTRMNTFSELLMLGDLQDEEKILQEEESHNLVTKIRTILSPFMLRRLKTDVLTLVPKKEVTVYCPMSELQLKLYDMVIERNIAGLKGEKAEDSLDLEGPPPKRKCTVKTKTFTKFYLREDCDVETHSDDDVIMIENEEEKEQKEKAKIATCITMCSPMMMFRKIVNHPYLVNFPLDPNSETKQVLIDEGLVTASGKMMVLDAMLKELKKRGHKVLLFTQFTMVLDIIEDYLLMRHYDYRRLDGSMNLEERAANIDDFNKDPNVLIFLLSTRAGGVGLNLTGADTVIFFDRDWNPQMDIQAQDRCHRIGQTKPVVIYHLISKNTIDDHIVRTSQMKRVLEKVVIADKKFKSISHEERVRFEDILIELRKALQKPKDDSYVFSNKMELNRLLDRSDLYAQMGQIEKKTPAKESKRKKARKENIKP